MQNPSSRLYVFEGGDACGKQIQSKMLVNHFLREEKAAIYTDEPSVGEIGDLIRKSLDINGKHRNPKTLQIRFTADRADHVEDVIGPALEKGTIVVADRYWPSTIAYAIALGLDEETVESLLRLNLTFPKPNSVFILDLPPTVAVKRMQERGRPLDKHEEDVDLQRRVRSAYHQLQNRFGRANGWFIIDASGSKEDIHKKVLDAIDALEEPEKIGN